MVSLATSTSNEPPRWLASHLQAGESVRWWEEPDASAQRGAAVSVAIAAFLAFVVGVDSPRWWTFLLPRDTPRPAPWLSAVLAFALFAGSSAQDVMQRAFTGTVVTDRRLVRANKLGWGGVESYPLGAVRVVERDRDKRRPRVRLQVNGKKRFRLRVRDPDGFVAALGA